MSGMGASGGTKVPAHGSRFPLDACLSLLALIARAAGSSKAVTQGGVGSKVHTWLTGWKNALHEWVRLCDHH